MNWLAQLAQNFSYLSNSEIPTNITWYCNALCTPSPTTWLIFQVPFGDCELGCISAEQDMFNLGPRKDFFFPTIIKCWTLCQERHRWNRSLRFGCPQPGAGLLCPHHPYQQWVFTGPAYLVDVVSAIVCGPSFWRCICLCCCSGSLWVWCEEGHHLWSDTWEALSTDVFVAFAVDKCSSLYCSMNSRS